MEVETEEEFLPWPVYVSQHAKARAKEKFKLKTDEEAEAFIRGELGNSTSTRRRRDGALRWTTEKSQLVTRQDAAGIHVITCYPKPKGRGWRKKKHITWRSPYQTHRL